uniref:retinitis pigmentosa 1-like 1 protein n=1 Tax=Myxine glutinosa TaxID=7769 RepID=UPI00358FD8CA
MGENLGSPFRYYGGTTPRTPTHWEQRAANALLEYQQASAYLASYNRTQFKAFLSQVNPELIPRILKANCRDAAVQVNPWRETAVQCSLGSRTLTPRPVIPNGGGGGTGGGGGGGAGTTVPTTRVPTLQTQYKPSSRSSAGAAPPREFSRLAGGRRRPRLSPPSVRQGALPGERGAGLSGSSTIGGRTPVDVAPPERRYDVSRSIAKTDGRSSRGAASGAAATVSKEVKHLNWDLSTKESGRLGYGGVSGRTGRTSSVPGPWSRSTQQMATVTWEPPVNVPRGKAQRPMRQRNRVQRSRLGVPSVEQVSEALVPSTQKVTSAKDGDLIVLDAICENSSSALVGGPGGLVGGPGGLVGGPGGLVGGPGGLVGSGGLVGGPGGLPTLLEDPRFGASRNDRWAQANVKVMPKSIENGAGAAHGERGAWGIKNGEVEIESLDVRNAIGTLPAEVTGAKIYAGVRDEFCIKDKGGDGCVTEVDTIILCGGENEDYGSPTGKDAGDGAAVVAEGDAVVAEGDAVVAEGDAVVAEGDAVVAEGDDDAPAVAEGDDDAPAVAEGDDDAPAVAEGDEEAPAVAEGDEEAPAVAEGDEDAPAVAEGDEDAPAVAEGDEDAPAVAEGDEDAPAVAEGDEDAPAVAEGDEDAPAVAEGDEDAPAVAEGDEDAPAVAEGDEDAPAVAEGDEDALAVAELAPAVAEGDDDVVAEGDDDAVAEGDDDAVAEGDDDAVAEGDDDAVAEGDDDAVAEGDDDAVAEGDDDAVAEGDDDAVAEGDDDAVAEGDDDAVAVAKGDDDAPAVAEGDEDAPAVAEGDDDAPAVADVD